MKPRRIFMGITETAGYYRRLARGFVELGVPHTFVDLSTMGPRVFGGYEGGPLIRAIRGLAAGSWLSQRLSWILRVFLLVPVVLRHDVFLFGFGTSLLPRNLDLPLL